MPWPHCHPDIKRKLALLKLADELGNVSRACRILGFHRDTYYEVRRAFETRGVAGLTPRKRGPRGAHPRRIAAELEAHVVAHAARQPFDSAEVVARELAREGERISASGVRSIWQRHSLETRSKRVAHAKGVAVPFPANVTQRA